MPTSAIFKLKHRLGYPENYLFSLSKKIFSGSPQTKKHSITSGNRTLMPTRSYSIYLSTENPSNNTDCNHCLQFLKVQRAYTRRGNEWPSQRVPPKWQDKAGAHSADYFRQFKDMSNCQDVKMMFASKCMYVCIFLQQYRILMDIGNSKNYLGI